MKINQYLHFIKNLKNNSLPKQFSQQIEVSKLKHNNNYFNTLENFFKENNLNKNNVTNLIIVLDNLNKSFIENITKNYNKINTKIICNNEKNLICENNIEIKNIDVYITENLNLIETKEEFDYMYYLKYYNSNENDFFQIEFQYMYFFKVNKDLSKHYKYLVLEKE